MRRALAALGAAVVVAACGRCAPPTEQPDPGVVHVHGLDVDAEDGSLSIATHTGLFRVVEGRRCSHGSGRHRPGNAPPCQASACAGARPGLSGAVRNLLLPPPVVVSADPLMVVSGQPRALQP